MDKDTQTQTWRPFTTYSQRGLLWLCHDDKQIAPPKDVYYRTWLDDGKVRVLLEPESNDFTVPKDLPVQSRGYSVVLTNVERVVVGSWPVKEILWPGDTLSISIKD